MAEAARVAEGQGRDFVDVNLGCPIDEVTRRGFGASLLQRPSKVAAIVAAMKAAVGIPVTIKLRLGWSEGEQAYLKVARAAVGVGVDAIALHARSRAQRYRRPRLGSTSRRSSPRFPSPSSGTVTSSRGATRSAAWKRPAVRP